MSDGGSTFKRMKRILAVTVAACLLPLVVVACGDPVAPPGTTVHGMIRQATHENCDWLQVQYDAPRDVDVKAAAGRAILENHCVMP